MTPIVANIAQPLIDIVAWILVALHGIIGGSWGYAIVVLTLLVRLALLPLALMMARSMHAMARVAPELKELQAKHQGDKQRQQQEVMKFYAENNINPFSSCLPLFPQVLVFIALFFTLKDDLKRDVCPEIVAYAARIQEDVRDLPCGKVPGAEDSASFLFVPDLTAEPVGVVATVLILLLGASSLLAALAAGAGKSATQRQLAMASPILAATFFVYADLPSGLVAYWTTTNVWTGFQSRKIKRATGEPLPTLFPWGGRSAAAGALGRLPPPQEGKISVSNWLRNVTQRTNPPCHGEILAFADWYEGPRELASAPRMGVDSTEWLLVTADRGSERNPADASTFGAVIESLSRACPERRTMIADFRRNAEARRGPAGALLLAGALLKQWKTFAGAAVGGTAFALLADAYLGDLAPLAPAIEIPLSIGAINAAMDAAKPKVSVARLPHSLSILLTLIPVGLTAGATIVFLAILGGLNPSFVLVVGLGAVASAIALSATFRGLSKLKEPTDWLTPDPANVGRPG